MEVYLIRHTTPDIETGICYGFSDISSAATSFAKESKRAVSFLPECLDAIYSSPLLRCMQLARALQTESIIQEDARLMEMNFGSWEKKKWEEIDSTALNSWMKDFVHVRAPEGENFLDLSKRAGAFFDELASSGHKSVGIVTHAGVIRALIAKILGMPLENAFKIPVAYASVTKIRIQEESCYCNLEFLNLV
jgi:alpha-ribazole phosphatase